MNESKLPVIGHPFILLDEVFSTNAWLEDYTTKSTPPEGFTVQAVNQTHGKGQFGSSWHSSPGKNLAMSIYLVPDFLQADAQFALAQIASLAIYRTLAPHVQDVHIKWPNDIMLRDKKVAGILIQNTIQGKTIRQSIIGIGLNVFERDFPHDLPLAGSLAMLTDKPWSMEILRNEILHHLHQAYTMLRLGQRASIHQDYHDALYRRGRPSRFQTIGQAPFTGIIQGVEQSGHIMVENTETNLIQAYALKEIQFL